MNGILRRLQHCRPSQGTGSFLRSLRSQYVPVPLRRRFRSRLLAAAWLSATIATVVGCGGDDSMGRVRGIVTLDGDVVTRGTVQFLPRSGRGAKGQIEEDGTFVLGTFGETDGASVGVHRVAIIAYERGPGGRPDPTTAAKFKALVPEKYLAPGTSDLTYEVKPGDNFAEFALTSEQGDSPN